MQDSSAQGDEDLFHFISYVPIHGALYELDGLSSGPVNLGRCWRDTLRKDPPTLSLYCLL